VIDLVVALGLVLVLEGTFYALAPETAKSMMRAVSTLPEGRLRFMGVVALGFGVCVVWLVRG